MATAVWKIGVGRFRGRHASIFSLSRTKRHWPGGVSGCWFAFGSDEAPYGERIFQSLGVHDFVVERIYMENAVVILMGAGGHCASVMEAIRQSGGVQLFGLLDNAVAVGEVVNGLSVIGGDDLLPELRAKGVTHFAITVGSTGDNTVRQRLFESAVRCGLLPLTVIHPSAVLSPSAVLGDGVQVLAGAVIGAGASVAENVIINTGAIVEHHCQVGAHVHVASGACLCGGVCVAPRAFVGARAVVRQTVTVGDGAVVGMGSAVIRNVEAGTTVCGVPAARMRAAED